MNINTVSVTVNVAVEPEVRESESGKKYLSLFCLGNFSTEEDGDPLAVRAVLFGAQAEAAEKALVKGQEVVLLGRFKMDMSKEYPIMEMLAPSWTAGKLPLSKIADEEEKGGKNKKRVI